jgi:GTP-binding protein
VNKALQDALAKHSPPVKHGHQVHILYGYQRMGHPPAFEIFCNHPESTTPAYLRFLESEVRKAFDMESTPMQIVLKAKKIEHRPKPKIKPKRRTKK